jgi:hypothetical protein
MKSVISYMLILIVSVIGIEIIAQLWVYSTQDIFILNRNISLNEKSELPNDTRQKLSPIFGYTLRPDWKASDYVVELDDVLDNIGENSLPDYWSIPANNYGFLSRYDYPYISQNTNAFYVLILGGSVANGLALISEQDIANAINMTPGFDKKEVVLINLTMGGFKQPQNTQALSYFLAIGQPADLIINMDGLNEAHIGWSNAISGDIEHTLPYYVFMYGLLNNFVSKEKLESNKYISNIFKQTRSGIIYLYAKILLERDRKIITKLENEISKAVDGRQYPMVLQTNTKLDIDSLSDDIADTWARGSIAVKGLAEAFGAKYIHAIQPNQYYSKKVFLPEEASIAFSDPEWEGANIVKKTYDKFIGKINYLERKGVAFVNLVPAFDGTTERLYFDTCCHFIRKGYEIIMQDYLSDEIKNILLEK